MRRSFQPISKFGFRFGSTQPILCENQSWVGPRPRLDPNLHAGLPIGSPCGAVDSPNSVYLPGRPPWFTLRPAFLTTDRKRRLAFPAR